MAKFRTAGALAVLCIAFGPAIAEPAADKAPENPPQSGVKGAHEVEPGKTGPGSEKNSQVSPTSPDIPTKAQPPPEINLSPGDASGSATPGSPSKPE
ncbi:hypothetical protein DLM45_08805 [Hyphomicrobium methylovorum]|uniref:hypothetical protein n=1 Tax=Hyphomicrobium methylovorum TaxID=84 RepID=UPI0015E78414|nr:hypothetical protein [Hyphomicrobium methylovorum]MBA2126322.1 hypothetical protein [Hyphomicrobium methylovorum]